MIRDFVKSLVESIVRALVKTTSSYVAVERIVNGAFASADSWTITAAKWTIAAGVATEAGTGNGLNQSFDEVDAGREIQFSCDCTGTQGTSVILTSGGTAVQTLYGGIPIGGTITVSTTADAAFDGIRFQTTSAGATALDNVSLIA